MGGIVVSEKILEKNGMSFNVGQVANGWNFIVKAKGIKVAELEITDSEMLKVCAQFERFGEALLGRARTFLFICTGPCDYRNQMTGLGEPKELHTPTQCPKCGQETLR